MTRQLIRFGIRRWWQFEPRSHLGTTRRSMRDGGLRLRGRRLRGGSSATQSSGDAGASSPDGGDDGFVIGPTGLRHPGVLVNAAELSFVKQKIQSAASPWNPALASTPSHPVRRSARTRRIPSPTSCVVRIRTPTRAAATRSTTRLRRTRRPSSGCSSGSSAYAQNAIAIDERMVGRPPATHRLQRASAVRLGRLHLPASSQEIIRYSNAGWAPADVTRFETMLKTAYLPESRRQGERQRVDLSMIESDDLRLPFFLDDQTTFQTAVSMWQKRVPAYLYRD